MKIQTGNEFLETIKPVNGDSVSFVADDGQEMFRVKIGANNRSLIITSINTCIVDGCLYGVQLNVEPKTSNQMVVSTQLYDQK